MPSESRARWEVVYDQLREAIEAGTLTQGAQVPGELQLAETHGVSRNTVRTALARLQQEGLITEGQGRLGRTVRRFTPFTWTLTRFERGERRDDATLGTDDWSSEVLQQGRTPRQEVSVLIEPASADVAHWLGIQPREMVVRRSRRRSVDDVPYQLSDSYFPESIARGTPLMNEGDVTMPGGILSAIGHPQHEVQDEIATRMPTPREARELHLGMGVPVFRHVRIGYGADKKAVRAMVTIAPGDRTLLLYKMEV